MRIFIVSVLFSIVGLSIQECCGTVIPMPWPPFAIRHCRERYPRMCNVFCCNCDMPCWTQPMRSSSRFSRSHDNESQLHFNAIDSNGDGVISRKEGSDFLFNGTDSAREKRDIENGEWFTSMDKNMDGVIQAGEFDASLV